MTPEWVVVVQAIASIAGVVNIFFLIYQLVIMRGQLVAAQQSMLSQQIELAKQTATTARSTQGQNVFDLISYLEEPRHLIAREAVGRLDGKPLDEWTDADKGAADLVCRLWTMAAALQRMRVLPDRFVHYLYGGSVVRAWRIVEPYVLDLRARTHVSQRAEFETFAKEVEDLGWFVDGEDRRPQQSYPSMLM